VKFKNHERKLKHPFVLYADFESIIKHSHGCKKNPEESFTTLNAKHIPSGFCIHLKSAITLVDSQLSDVKPFVYRGTGGSSKLVVETFLNTLEGYAKMYYDMTRPKTLSLLL